MLDNPVLLYGLIAFAVIELAVATLVIRHVLARRAAARGSGDAPAIPSFRKLKEFTDAIHPRIGEIVRANWSGDSMSLPGVLAMALDEAEREARSRELPIDREILKTLVEQSLAKHGVARGGQLREALKQVA